MAVIPLTFELSRRIHPRDLEMSEADMARALADPHGAKARAERKLASLQGQKEYSYSFCTVLHDYDKRTITFRHHREQEAPHYGISPASDIDLAIWAGLQANPPDILAELNKSPWDLTSRIHRRMF